jgi:hypothetical protein
MVPSHGKTSATQHIINQILKTAYPLEIEVSEAMEHDWSVFNNLPYVDRKEGKTREIDIYAVHLSEPAQVAERNAFFIATDAVVECKKSDTYAWVFFSRPVRHPLTLYPHLGDGQTLDFLQVFSDGKERFIDHLSLPKLHYADFTRVSRTYSEVKIQGETSCKDAIFEASNQLMNYISDELEGVRKSFESTAGDMSRKSIHLRFPIIVFDGMLYDAIIKAGRLELRERSRIALETLSRSTTGKITHYLIDVVTKSSLTGLLRDLNADIASIRAYFKANNEQLVKIANNLVAPNGN